MKYTCSYYRHNNGVSYKMHCFIEMHFAAYFYTVVPYQARFRLPIHKNLTISKSGAFFLSFCKIRDFGSPTNTLWSCQNVCDALTYLPDNIYIRFGTKLYRQIVGIPMATNCAPLVADLFLFCYERDFMDSLNHDNQVDVIEAFNSTSRYLDDLLNI